MDTFICLMIVNLNYLKNKLHDGDLECVAIFISGRNCFCENMQERYKSIKEKNTSRLDQHSEGSGEYVGICLEKSLSAALDSFDNLFCRRCLVCTKALSF